MYSDVPLNERKRQMKGICSYGSRDQGNKAEVVDEGEGDKENCTHELGRENIRYSPFV